MPHGHCYLWMPEMIGLQVGSNFFIGLAYASIAATLAVLVRRIRNIPFPWVYIAFGIFILSCGLTHWFDVVTVWHPLYWADGVVRVITAVASVATAVMILPLVPQAVALAGTARLSQERGRKLEAALADLKEAHELLAQREQEAQRRAELREEQLHSLVETMPQLTWISTPHGENLFRNRRWGEYTGISLEELNERGWASVHSPETREHVLEAWKRSLATGKLFEVESRMRRADGEYRWFLARAVPLIDRSGTITGWVGTCTDIHDQRSLRDEALRTARMKDEFLATVSHELRTPLTAILGWSRMLRADSLPASTRERALEIVERNALAQVQLIDDLLDVSRIISGKMRLDLDLTDPAGPVEMAIEAVRPTATTKGVRLISSLDRHAGPVMADGGRLQQIVWNLVANAVKFSPRGGQVSVTLTRIDSHVEIAVADDGIGISPSFLPHVFERFSQADGSIRRAQGGLGLGLAIARHLVELHGGQIRAESAGEGRGAKFVVEIPLTVVEHARSEPPGLRSRDVRPMVLNPPPELHGLRVLLVEDEADSREMVATVLGECGAEVTLAEDAEAALRLAGEKTFDVILSDIGLPGRDGYALIEALRNLPELSKAPAAALTAYTRAEDRHQALSAGYQMHIPKPVDPTELIAITTDLARIAMAMRS